MTDTFTVCALRTRPVDASNEDSDLHVFAAGATRFTFENGRWTSASSSWIGGATAIPMPMHSSGSPSNSGHSRS